MDQMNQVPLSPPCFLLSSRRRGVYVCVETVFGVQCTFPVGSVHGTRYDSLVTYNFVFEGRGKTIIIISR